MARAAAKLKPKTVMFRMFRFVLLCFVSFRCAFWLGLAWFGFVVCLVSLSLDIKSENM